MKENKIKLGLVIGGKSVEHDISILSGMQAYHAIDKEKYDITIFYITKEQSWLVGSALSSIDTYINNDFSKCNQVTLFGENNHVFYKGIFNKPKATPIDVFLLVLHGEGAEDGSVQGFLETIGATYTSCSVTEAAIFQDKIYTKQILESIGITTVPYKYISLGANIDEFIINVNNSIDFPVIIKPSKLGSSIGIHIANNNVELKKGLEESFKYGERILIEKKILKFKEYNIAVVKNTNQTILSDIEEVKPSLEFLSFKDKYENLGKLSEAGNRIIPAKLDELVEKEIKKIAIRVYEEMNLKGVVRIDLLYDVENNQIFLNEINTIPGSLAFYLFTNQKISFTNLIDIMIKNAIIKKRQQEQLVKSFKTSVLSSKGQKLLK